MSDTKHCWEIKNCGRQCGGANVREFGECIASKEGMGHSCWAVAGTLCGGVVQGTAAQKEKNCMACELYKMYNRTSGSKKDTITIHHSDELERYKQMILSRSKTRYAS